MGVDKWQLVLSICDGLRIWRRSRFNSKRMSDPTSPCKSSGKKSATPGRDECSRIGLQFRKAAKLAEFEAQTQRQEHSLVATRQSGKYMPLRSLKIPLFHLPRQKIPARRSVLRLGTDHFVNVKPQRYNHIGLASCILHAIQ